MTIHFEEKYKSLAERAISCLENSPNSRVIIAIEGIPGSGKSTTAKLVSEYINSCSSSSKRLQSVVVGMDGYHLSRSELSKFPDPATAFARRGAPFTFNAEGVVNFVKKLRSSCTLSFENPVVIKAPSFDHAVKDPIEDGTIIEPNANIVFIEGLYLLINEPPWSGISNLVDEKWFIEVDFEEARRRVAKRHLEAGIEPDLQKAYERADSNDMLNAQYILDHLVPHFDLVF